MTKKELKEYAIAILVIALLVLIAHIARGQEIGYSVIVDTDSAIYYKDTTSIDYVNEMFVHFFDQSYDLEPELKNNIYVQHRNSNVIFYVEKKYIVRSKRKVKYKSIRRINLNTK